MCLCGLVLFVALWRVADLLHELLKVIYTIDDTNNDIIENVPCVTRGILYNDLRHAILQLLGMGIFTLSVMAPISGLAYAHIIKLRMNTQTDESHTHLEISSKSSNSSLGKDSRA